MQHNWFQILWYLWQIKNRSSTRIIRQMAQMADILFLFRRSFVNLWWSLHHKCCHHPLFVVWLENRSTRQVVPFFHCWSQYGERVCWLLTNPLWSRQQHKRRRCQQRWGWLCQHHCCWYRSHEARTGSTTTVTHHQYHQTTSCWMSMALMNDGNKVFRVFGRLHMTTTMATTMAWWTAMMLEMSWTFVLL